MGLETDPIAVTSIKMIIGTEEITITEVVTGIIGPIMGITVGPKIGTTSKMVISTITGQIIEGKTVTTGMVTEIRTAADPGIEIEIGEAGVAPEKVPNPEAVVDPKTDMKIGDRVGMIPEIKTGLSQDLNLLLM